MVDIDEYFETAVPEMFKEQVLSRELPPMEGTRWSIQYNIDGEPHSLEVRDARDLSYTKGPVEDPMMAIDISRDAWELAARGELKGSEMFSTFEKVADRKVYDAVSNARGVLNLEVSQPDESIVNVRITFNGSDSPTATVKASADVLDDIQSGKIAAPMAYMQGKIRIEGDIPFVLSLNELLSG